MVRRVSVVVCACCVFVYCAHVRGLCALLVVVVCPSIQAASSSGYFEGRLKCWPRASTTLPPYQGKALPRGRPAGSQLFSVVVARTCCESLPSRGNKKERSSNDLPTPARRPISLFETLYNSFFFTFLVYFTLHPTFFRPPPPATNAIAPPGLSQASSGSIPLLYM